MKLTNKWVGYLDRSYLQIKNSVLDRLGQLVPEMTDHSESNIMVILVSIFSGIGESLNYYIDNMAREAFLPTARRYSSAVRHARLIDYRIKAAIPATVDVRVRFENEAGANMPVTSNFTIPAGTTFRTENALEFINIEDVNVIVGTSTLIIPVEQKTLVENQIIGTTEADPEILYSLGTDYADNTLILFLDGVLWERKDTLGRSGPNDEHYIVDISEDKIAYIKFGDNINGKTPAAGQQMVGTYYITQGVTGNVDVSNINETDFDFSPYVQDGTLINTSNPLKAVGGTNYEGLDRIKRSAPLSLRTLDRAVTRQDYEDIAKLAPGVDKAKVFFECGKNVDIYISPNGGGVAQTSLLESTRNYIDQRDMVTTIVRCLPTGESFIYLKATVNARFRMDKVVTKSDIITTLTDNYSYENSDINAPIMLSDVYALIDNLDKVDNLTIDEFYLVPYFRPIDHEQNIQPTIEILSGSTNIVNWRLVFHQQGTFRLYKEESQVGIITPGQEFTDDLSIMSIIIPPDGYDAGDTWEFKTYPLDKNLIVEDYSIPIITESHLDITVNEKLTI